MTLPIDLNLVRVFATMYQVRNTSRAADRLGLSQSAVSNALKRMRLIFDDPLFVLSSEGMQPTPRADGVAKHITEALLLIESAVEDRDVFDPATSTRTFRLYLSDLAQKLCLHPLLTLLREHAPHLSIETVDALPNEARQMMEQGQLDLAIGYLASLGEGFHRQTIKGEQLVCLVRKDHPVIRDSLSLDQYRLARHVIYVPHIRSGLAFDGEIEAFCKERGFQRHAFLRLAYAFGLDDAVANSDCISTVTGHFAHVAASKLPLNIFPLPFSVPEVEIVLQWHGRAQKDRGHAWIRSKIAASFREVQPLRLDSQQSKDC